MKNLLFTLFALGIALSISAQRVYINPGHGDWGPNSRPMATVPFPNLHATTGGPDTLGFYESNTNLWKAFALNEKLQSAGYTTMMSRTENGPYPYVSGDESIDKPLADICAEVNWFEADYFISIHSNANVDGDNVNFPLIIHSGYDGAGFQDERNMALSIWPRLFEAFGNDKYDTNIDHGFEPNSAYALNEDNVRGSISFYGYNLGTLLHNYQGYLVEGYFHTYQPARHRALNPEWCRQEGIRYFRGIQDYYRKAGENVGYIMGCVRSLTEMSHHLFNSMSTSYDEFLPINGAKVVLRDASGNIIRTECYRHVARHITDQYYYITDHNYNGIFVFENLQPGEYTLTVHAAGYEDKEMEVTVTANATVYPEIFLTKGQGTEPQINVDVKWVLNGGTVDGHLPQAITGSPYTLPTPSKAGYIFLGWFDNPNGTGTPLTSIPAGWQGTLYAIWRETSVKWELNGGKVYPYNQWLWDDFQKTKLGRDELVSIADALTVINAVDNATFHSYLTDGEYKWLGDYLWGKFNHIQDDGSITYTRWKLSLDALLNCKTISLGGGTIDFTEAGKPSIWREYAKEQGAHSRFYSPVTLPNQITYSYTIPTPEKEGATFQGWYDNPNGTGTALTTLPAGYEGTVYAIWVGPVPCIVAYDLTCNYRIGQMAFEFSFYANTQPTAGKLKFYNMNEEPIGEYTINYLKQGRNTIVLKAEDIPALGELIVGRDFLWEVYLEARPSTLFAEIFRSNPFYTAYATIDNSPESDFFGSIWVASQQSHGYGNKAETDFGGIWRLVPEQGYTRDGGKDAEGHRPHRPRPGDPRPNGDRQQPPRWDGQQPPQGGGGQPKSGGGKQEPPRDGQPQGGGGKQEPPQGGQPDHTPTDATQGGFEVIFRPTVAPDGTVYLTDNGSSYGGVFMMDPHTKQITNFFEGCDYENGEWKMNGTVVGSGSTGAHIYWTEDGDNKNGFSPDNAKLYLMHNAHITDDPNGETRGFFTYDLMNNNPSFQHTDLKHFPNQQDGLQTYINTAVTDYAIVGISRGAWVCQLRKEDKNVISDPSLTFYPTEGDPTIFSKSLDSSVGGIFGDNELIHGSFGSAIAVNKDETLLAMVGGTGNIMLFDIEWSENTPTLTNKRDYPIVADDSNTTGEWDIPTITTLNFDYAGNLVATIGETYNDRRDQHMVTIYTMPKAENNITVPARYSHRVPSLVEDDQCMSIAKPNTAYETVELYRNLQAGMYNTICLPFGINTLEGTPYQGASVLKFVGTEIEKVGGEDMLKLLFQELTFQEADTMVAGVPYLIKPAQDITKPVILSNVFTANSVQGTSIKPTNSLATFHGITSPVEIQEDPKILFLVANNRLATASSTGMMMANRAYFELADAQNLPKRSIISIIQPTSSGIEQIYNYYSTETYKFLYNGTIVIVRDGVMYDIMGVRIK